MSLNTKLATPPAISPHTMVKGPLVGQITTGKKAATGIIHIRNLITQYADDGFDGLIWSFMLEVSTRAEGRLRKRFRELAPGPAVRRTARFSNPDTAD